MTARGGSWTRATVRVDSQITQGRGSGLSGGRRPSRIVAVTRPCCAARRNTLQLIQAHSSPLAILVTSDDPKDTRYPGAAWSPRSGAAGLEGLGRRIVRFLTGSGRNRAKTPDFGRRAGKPRRCEARSGVFRGRVAPRGVPLALGIDGGRAPRPHLPLSTRPVATKRARALFVAGDPYSLKLLDGIHQRLITPARPCPRQREMPTPRFPCRPARPAVDQRVSVRLNVTLPARLIPPPLPESGSVTSGLLAKVHEWPTMAVRFLPRPPAKATCASICTARAVHWATTQATQV